MGRGMGEVRLLSECEVADLLRVKPCTVRNERVRGKLGFIRIGARIFYTPEQVTEYLENQTMPTRDTQRRHRDVSTLPPQPKPAVEGDATVTETETKFLDTDVSKLDKKVLCDLAELTFGRPKPSRRREPR